MCGWMDVCVYWLGQGNKNNVDDERIIIEWGAGKEKAFKRVSM